MNEFGNSFGNWLYATKAFAQDLIPCPDGTMADPSIGCAAVPESVISSESSIAELILKIASGLMVAVAVAAVLMLIYGGITYALAAGDDEKIRKAKRLIFWSVAGLVISILARAIAQFVLGAIV